MSSIPSSNFKKIDPNIAKTFWHFVVGVAQGAALYFLYTAIEAHTWPATDRTLLQVFLFTAFLVPIILLTSIGTLKFRDLIAWALLLSGVLAFLAAYNADMHQDLPDVSNRMALLSNLATSSPLLYMGQLLMFATAMLFIAQTLVLAACRDGRYIAKYATYFDVSWRLQLRLLLALNFMLLFGLILIAGAALLKIVELDFLSKLLEHSWFDIPAATLAFAAGIYFAEMRPTVVDYLLARLKVTGWLLPMLVLIAGAFLAKLPIVGLNILWNTHHAAITVFGVAYMLVILINAVYRNGMERPGIFLGLFGWLGSLMLLPLTGLAIYALYVRVGQYGWSIQRIIGASWLIVAACYAIGYAIAVVKPGRWLQAVETTNIVAAFVILAILLGLFTPIADPMRLMVASQIDRLNSGAVTIEKFDFPYLIKNGGSYAKTALDNLKSDKTRIDAAILEQEINKAPTPLVRQHTIPTCQPGQRLSADTLGNFTCVDNIPSSSIGGVTPPAGGAPFIPVPPPVAGQTRMPDAVIPPVLPKAGAAAKGSNPAALGFQQFYKCTSGGAISLGDTVTPDACLASCKIQPHAAGCWWLDGNGGFKRECRVCKTTPPSKDIWPNDWGLSLAK